MFHLTRGNPALHRFGEVSDQEVVPKQCVLVLGVSVISCCSPGLNLGLVPVPE